MFFFLVFCVWLCNEKKSQLTREIMQSHLPAVGTLTALDDFFSTPVAAAGGSTALCSANFR